MVTYYPPVNHAVPDVSGLSAFEQFPRPAPPVKINGVLLVGDMTSEQLHLASADDMNKARDAIAELADNKQDALSADQLENIDAVPEKANAADVKAALDLKRNLTDRSYTVRDPSDVHGTWNVRSDGWQYELKWFQTVRNWERLDDEGEEIWDPIVALAYESEYGRWEFNYGPDTGHGYILYVEGTIGDDSLTFSGTDSSGNPIEVHATRTYKTIQANFVLDEGVNGKTYDLSTDVGVKTALSALITAFGGMVES